MILFVIFVIWIAVLSVAVVVAYEERKTGAYITLVILALVLIIIIFLAIFTPELIGV